MLKFCHTVLVKDFVMLVSHARL